MSRVLPYRSFAISLLLPLACLLFASTAQARQMVSIDRSEVNMRTGPGTHHDATWVLSRGYPLLVLARQGQWLKVRDFENDEGWVYRPLTDRTAHFIVKSKTANIRSGPGTKHRIVGKASYGDVLKTLSRRGSWARVRSESGVVGWVARKLLWGW